MVRLHFNMLLDFSYVNWTQSNSISSQWCIRSGVEVGCKWYQLHMYVVLSVLSLLYVGVHCTEEAQ